MQLTRAADYAVRVMVHLATLPPSQRASRADLARAADASPAFVAKILQQLAEVQLVHSYAGRSGGFELARPPADVSLLDVVVAIDGPLCLNHCLPPLEHCARRPLCNAHPVWREAQDAMRRVLGSASLESMARPAAPRPVLASGAAAEAIRA